MCKALLFDEDEVIRMLCKETLLDEGFSVVETERHDTLCKMIEEESPDILIMDADSDYFDGIDLLQTIRGRHHELLIILCTAYPQVEYDPKAHAADYVLFKGSEMCELLKSRIQLISEPN